MKCEPVEELTVNVPEEYASKIIDMVTRRKGEMVKMETAGGDRVNLEFVFFLWSLYFCKSKREISKWQWQPSQKADRRVCQNLLSYHNERKLKEHGGTICVFFQELAMS